METNTFLVADIFEKVFGYNPVSVPADALLSRVPTLDRGNYVIGKEQQAQSANPFTIAQSSGRKQYTAKGSPLWGGKDLLGREMFMPISVEVPGGKTYNLPYAVVSIRSSKKMVETAMTERGGSVHELIGLSDWQISLKGFVYDPLGDFPDEQLSELNELYQINEPVRLKCALTDLFMEATDYVIIKSIDIGKRPKVIGVRDYTMELVSDSILTLTLED